MSPLLIDAGYSYNEQTSIWTRLDYTGIAYSDGDEVEIRIAAIINNATELGVLSDSLRQYCTDWPSLYHLSGSRANILRPFESYLSGDVLEIGAGCGAITRYLGECGGNVLALEGSPRRAAIAKARTRDLSNVSVVSDKFDAFECDKKFDLITLIGVLEYANLFTSGENPTLSMLERVRSFLKPNGKLIIAIENQLGLKYFAGAPEDHLGIPMYGVEDRYRNDQPQTFGHKILAELLTKAGFKSNDFLVPFPDYKVPASIVTENGFSCDDFDAAAFAWQSVRKDPQLPATLSFSPELVWPTVVQNKLAVDLANSFLIVASLDINEKLVCSNTLAWHFSSDRLSRYAKQAQFVCSNDRNIEVLYRLLSNKTDIGHTEKLFTFNLPKADSYKLGLPLLKEAVLIVTQDGWHPVEVGQFLLNFLKVLSELLKLDFDAVKSSPYCKLPGNAFDLTPQNIISLKNGEFATIDHEWVLHDDIEVGHLLFRSLISILNTVTKFGRAGCVEQLTRGDFVFQSLAAAGFTLEAPDIERYLQREEELRYAILGIKSHNYLEWEAKKPLSVWRENEALQSQLAATQAAKAYAEEVAYGHLSKLEALEAQLIATENAKAYAEELAIGRYNEIMMLRSEIAKIHGSKGYKLLAALQLIEKKGVSDV